MNEINITGYMKQHQRHITTLLERLIDKDEIKRVDYHYYIEQHMHRIEDWHKHSIEQGLKDGE